MTIARPVLTVCMIRCEHEADVEQAIEGALAQQTVFPSDLVIGRGGAQGNGAQPPRQAAARAGDYVALCDGDDYWAAARRFRVYLPSARTAIRATGI